METDKTPLALLAAKYIWWEDPATAPRDKNRFLAYVMNLATWPDAKTLEALFAPAELRAALDRITPGIMNPQSWHFWYWRLGYDRVPPLPVKKTD